MKKKTYRRKSSGYGEGVILVHMNHIMVFFFIFFFLDHFFWAQEMPSVEMHRPNLKRIYHDCATETALRPVPRIYSTPLATNIESVGISTLTPWSPIVGDTIVSSVLHSWPPGGPIAPPPKRHDAVATSMGYGILSAQELEATDTKEHAPYISIHDLLVFLEHCKISFGTIVLFVKEQIDIIALHIMFKQNELHLRLNGYIPSEEIDAIHLTMSTMR